MIESFAQYLHIRIFQLHCAEHLSIVYVNNVIVTSCVLHFTDYIAGPGKSEACGRRPQAFHPVEEDRSAGQVQQLD